MRITTQIISWLALAGTVVPSLLLLLGKMPLDQVKTIMLVASVVWFVFTPLWMGRQQDDQAYA